MFIFDCECHLLPMAKDISYFPLYKANQRALRSILNGPGLSCAYGIADIKTFDDWRAYTRRSAGSAPGESAAALVQKMDEAGVAMACVLPESFLPMTYGARMMSTNGWLANEVSKYPDRLMGVCNVGPHIMRGVKNVVWEVEHLVREMNFKAVKFYPVDDTPINNKEMWPFYEKLQSLGVPLFIHTGASYCVPGRSEYAYPLMLESVCEDFPELSILAYHMGYPFTDALNICAAKYPNLYIGTSMLPLFGHGLGKRSQILLAEAILWAGIDKIIWGTDMGANALDVGFLQKIQISEDLQKDYGYKPITDEDRAKWAGLNLARLLKITPPAL
ncbi:MAG: amidohydrolase family protein [Deltaproteobacteria bacterium]|nr:amidohydrolase family protein [Deltaproteobacteria bacterium]